MVYLKNITGRIKQQKKLAEVRLLQEHVINSTEDLIYAIDREFRLIIANNAFNKEMQGLVGKKYELGEIVFDTNDDVIFTYWRD